MPRLLLPYLLVFLVVLVVSSFLGSIPILPTEVWDSFVAGEATGSYHHWTDFRLQRLLFAAAVGGGLALAGTVFQAVLRNPLAEPYILGISGGASVGAVAARCLGGGAMLSTAVAGGDALAGAGALVGALLSILLLMSLAHWARLADPPSLILAGVVLNAIFGAMILLFYSLAPERLVKSSLHWLMGSIASDSYLGTTRLRDTALALFVGAALLMA
ncbi:MAG: iron chelate uptake ABC transporter family permease subunit, partial [Planctomycetota bacterium]